MTEFLLRALLAAAGALPLGALHALGGALGQLGWWVAPRWRARIAENIAQAGYPADLGPRAAREAGRQALEVAWVWRRPENEVRAVLEVVEPEVEQAALARGGPVIYLTPHLGCFEVASHYCALTHWRAPKSLTAMYRIPKREVFHALMRAGRTHLGSQLAPANAGGVRRMLRALREGNAVGILPDQVPSEGEGVWVPFFGRRAYTMTLPGKFAAATGAAVLFIAAERGRVRGRAGFRIRFQALSAPLTGDGVRDAAQINRDLERLIALAPAQYLWGYNRYKRPAGAPPPDEAAA